MNGPRAVRLEAADSKPAKGAVKIKSAPVKAPTEAEAWDAVRQTGVTV